MKNKRLITYIGIAILLTTAYVTFLIFTFISQNLKNQQLTSIQLLEGIIYRIYTDTYTENDLKKLKAWEQSERSLLQVGSAFASGLLSNDWQEFLTKYSDDEEDQKIMRDIALFRSGKGQALDGHVLLDEINLKVNLFPYYLNQQVFTEDYLAKNPRVYSELKELGIYYHDHDYLIFADQLFDLLATLPNLKDEEVLAWHGSTLTKFALTVSSPIDKVDFVDRGTKLIDRAAFDAPKNMIVRLVRFYNYLSLPAFFRKQEMAFKDLDLLIDAYHQQQPLEIIVGYGEVQLTNVDKDELIAALRFAIESPESAKDKKRELSELLEKLNP